VLFKDKLIAKHPGTTGYGLHQDYAVWQGLGLPAEALMTVALAIDRADASNGCLEIWPGGHSRLLTEQGDSDPTDEKDDIAEGDLEAASGGPVEMEAGDALLLHSLTVHRSGANLSGRPRRMAFFSYSAGRYGDLRGTYYERLRERQLALLTETQRAAAFFA
jgi:ectoine hydroxylase-related dioxygenase (phytanoyl-CoA dioxygenase family)